MPEFLLGMNAKLYFGTAGQALTELSLMENVKDLKLDLSAGEADVTTRKNKGWRATAATLRECTCEFKMLWLPGDAGFEAVKTAFLTSGQVRFAPLTGEKTSDGTSPVDDSEGPLADFSITGFPREEPLEDGVTIDVTAKLALFDSWIVDGMEPA